MQELTYDPDVAFSAGTELINILNSIDLSKLPKDENRKDLAYIIEGIQSFFRKLRNNEAVTSAPFLMKKKEEKFIQFLQRVSN